MAIRWKLIACVRMELQTPAASCMRRRTVQHGQWVTTELLPTFWIRKIEDQVNFTVYVPKVDEHFVGSLAVIPLQLLGYYVSVAKGLDVDKPRNLAKSVTVE